MFFIVGGFFEIHATYYGLTQEKLCSLALGEFTEIVPTLSPERFSNLTFSDEQLQAIPLNKLSSQQLQGLFPYDPDFASKEVNPKKEAHSSAKGIAEALFPSSFSWEDRKKIDLFIEPLHATGVFKVV